MTRDPLVLHQRLLDAIEWNARNVQAGAFEEATRAVVELHKPKTLAEIDENPAGSTEMHCEHCYRDSWWCAPYPCFTITVVAEGLGVHLD